MYETKDLVNQSFIDLEEKIGLQQLGLMNNAVWYEDPKRLVFTLARYKFVAKMLSWFKRVAEIGCGDGKNAINIESVYWLHDYLEDQNQWFFESIMF